MGKVNGLLVVELIFEGISSYMDVVVSFDPDTRINPWFNRPMDAAKVFFLLLAECFWSRLNIMV